MSHGLEKCMAIIQIDSCHCILVPLPYNGKQKICSFELPLMVSILRKLGGAISEITSDITSEIISEIISEVIAKVISEVPLRTSSPKWCLKWCPKWNFGDHFTDHFRDDLQSDLQSDLRSDLWNCTTKLPYNFLSYTGLQLTTYGPKQNLLNLLRCNLVIQKSTANSRCSQNLNLKKKLHMYFSRYCTLCSKLDYRHTLLIASDNIPKREMRSNSLY